MENVKEGGPVHRPKIIYDIKNPPKIVAKGNYEDCEDQIGYNSEEITGLLRSLVK